MPATLLRCAVALSGIALSSAALASWAVTGGGTGVTAGFPSVGMIGHRAGPGQPETFDCTGTLVGNGMFVLTARHCLIDSAGNDAQKAAFKLGDVTYYGFDIMYHPTADIAIVKLGVMLDGASQVYCPPSGGTLTGRDFCGVGFGLGSSNGGTATSTWDLAYGTKRVFYNRIDGLSPDGGLRGAGETAYEYDLDVPGGITGEGLHAPGDSGAPMFTDIDGMLKVMGVLSYSRGTQGPRPGTVAGGPPIDEWVKTRIPAPASILILTGILIAAPRRRGTALPGGDDRRPS